MRYLLIPILLILILIFAVVFGAPSSSDQDSDSEPENLPLAPPPKHDTAIVSAPDGTVYLVEIGSGKILWSFSSGPSTYSSYQQLPNQEGEKLNATADGDNFYIDCGEDWELYLHGNGLKKVKLPLSAEEFVKRTPFVSSGGGVMLGSKKTAVFLVDAKTGKVVRTIRSDDFSSDDKQRSEEKSIVTVKDIEEWLPAASPIDSESIEKPLYVTRTDYALKYTSLKTGKVLWYLMFADIEASFQCDGIENFLSKNPGNNGFGPVHNLDVHCQARPVVYRIRDRSSLEPLLMGDGLLKALPSGDEVVSLPATGGNHILDKLLALQLGNEKQKMLALPTSDQPEDFIIKSLPQISGHQDSDLGRPVFWHSVMYSSLVPMVMALFFYVRRSVVKRQSKLQERSEDPKLQNAAPKKKKGRKSGVNKGKKLDNNAQNGVTGGFEDTNIFSDNIEFTTIGRKIGKLVFTNQEIAKGSNGTIVLEGIYDGRPVAVKRLVRAHHDVAVKEIQNLIASDQHPNIVRWYGVEYDQDFVYLSLERCSCSLHDLILFYNSQNQITKMDQDHEFTSPINLNMQVWTKDDFELWKVNGYPSPRMLKLMRDIACGLAHLHELGIIHRDLKPQNVLVIKDRSISAKISDMGISKRLDGDVTSLTKYSTGYGSSGWQAPEQLRRERQTRAIDLFSFGCILFFCMTGGKHPFGENLERDMNIVNNRKDLFLIDHIPEATDLISRLLDPIPHSRPKAVEVVHHPLFWNSEVRLSFLRDVSDRIELEDRENESQLLDALESRGKVALGGKWDEKMDDAFINDIGRYRRYKFDNVRDLLRVIRNKLNHYRELSKEIQVILGSVPEGFDYYFSSRFPKLLIEVYGIIVQHCADEEVFHKYFRSTRI